MEAILWIVLGIALAIAEAFTATVLIIFFALGALAAGGVAALGGGLLLQVITFAVVSGLSVGALRPIVLRHLRLNAETDETPMGIDAIESGRGTVVEEVDADCGLIKIDGELWQARSLDGHEKYLPGERVRVVKIIGTTVIVWRDDLPNF